MTIVIAFPLDTFVTHYSQLIQIRWISYLKSIFVRPRKHYFESCHKFFYRKQTVVAFLKIFDKNNRRQCRGNQSGEKKWGKMIERVVVMVRAISMNKIRVKCIVWWWIASIIDIEKKCAKQAKSESKISCRYHSTNRFLYETLNWPFLRLPDSMLIAFGWFAREYCFLFHFCQVGNLCIDLCFIAHFITASHH